MGIIILANSSGEKTVLNGKFFVSSDGRFLGEYFIPDDGITPDGILPAPQGGAPVDECPPSHRHVWKFGAWEDPGPNEADLRQQARADRAAESKAAALKKLEALGLTPEDIKAVLS